MRTAAPEFSTTLRSITIIALPDTDIDRSGHDARSRYVEQYWLGILGPSTTWLLRHIADELEASPRGFVLHLDETASRLGLAATGRNSPFMRALGRLCQFDMAKLQPGNVLAVRRRVPSLSNRHIVRLPDRLRQQHDFWQQKQLTDSAS